MTQQKRQKVFYVILAGAIVFGLLMKPWESSRRHDADEIQQQTQPVSATPPAVTAKTAATSGALSASGAYVDEWPRNPFAEDKIISPVNAPAAIAQDDGDDNLLFQGVITVGDEQACVVNNQTYRQGWIVNGWSIIHIQPEEILLVRDSDSLVLTLAAQDWE